MEYLQVWNCKYEKLGEKTPNYLKFWTTKYLTVSYKSL